MKILSSQQIREADAYTIANEPISSIDLMERASDAFVMKFASKFGNDQPVIIFCGMGNNGGDGLAVARMLALMKFKVTAYLVQYADKCSPDNEVNQNRLPAKHLKVIKYNEGLPTIPSGSIVIDALFGTGLNRPAEELAADVIAHINASKATVVAVDVPSGLFTDMASAMEQPIIKADYTYTFQLPKLAYLLCENSRYVGQWEVLDIGLSEEYIAKAETAYSLITRDLARSILKPREKCGHKGTYGHSLIIAGSLGKMGATILCGKACLRAGTGLLTLYTPSVGNTIIQTALPEAMHLADSGQHTLETIPKLNSYQAIGVGPGLGTERATKTAIKVLLEATRHCEERSNLVLDADALNCIAGDTEMLRLLSKTHILTPHPKEFERLAGAATSDWDRMEKATAFAKKYGCTIVLKTAYTSIHLPDGRVWFNTTGNPGMGTGGSGDVLTGILTGLLAQGYSIEDAAILGVYLHGLAGDLAAEEFSQQGMIAGDLVEKIGKAFLCLKQGLQD